MSFTPPIPERKPPVPEGFSSIIRGFSNTDILDHFKRMEKPIDYMYRDSEGYPTIGVGHLLNKIEDAFKLNFIVRSHPDDPTGRTASRAEIKQAYDGLPPQTKKGGGYSADYYDPFGRNKGLSPLFIPHSEVDYQLMNDIYTHADEVKKKFSGFDDFPPSAQKALIDMEFNMGPNFNAEKWPSLYRAVEQRDWLRAAQESNRKQVDETRNKVTKTLFNEGYNED